MYLITILTTGLSAGLFYAWAVSVIPGTKLVSDKTYMETMQAINRAIINPGFMVIFIGTLFLLTICTYWQFKIGVDIKFWFIIGATITYLIGTIGITAFGNVPLNETLDLVNVNQLSEEELRQTRASYEIYWNKLHNIRTVFAVVSFILLLLSTKVTDTFNSIIN